MKRSHFSLLGLGVLLLAASSAEASPHCAGEIDRVVIDGRTRVDVFDFNVLATSFGTLVPTGTSGDLDGDGDVDVFDFNFFAPSFGCVSQIVEPGGTARMVLVPDAITALVLGASGESTFEATDLFIAGRGLDFSWTRRYRSRLDPGSAMGIGWDFSYNIYVEDGPGTDLILHNGLTRADKFEDQGGGVWHDEESFCELAITPGPNTYTLTFPHGDTWSFHALDGSPQQGRISTMADRNGNAITFDYDGLGRLVTIHDTLDNPPTNPREVVITYNPNGGIDTITDFSGRQVTYDYYEDGDAGGSAGDLKSVTTPAVVGTPHGNDFPSGKTTTYTYTTGFEDETLNHNLLSVTDPKGQTFVVFEYAGTLAPADLEYDRVSRLTFGNPGEVLDFVYTPLVPAPATNNACLKVTVNDRVGNVEESLYDGGNRLVVRREHTGRADPSLPTDLDLLINPPGPPLRATDPPVFETRYEYDADSRLVRLVEPNQNETTYVYDAVHPLRRSQGNLLTVTRLPGPLGGDQPVIQETFEYDPVINFGSNFVTRHVDPRGNETTHQYDASGNRTHTTHRIPSIVEDYEYNAFGQMTRHILPDNGSGCRRVDLYVYYPIVDPQYGYLQSLIVDATDPVACPGPHFDLTTTYEYDSLGRRTRVIDPLGQDSLFEFNALDRVVRELSRETSPGSGIRYETLRFYDANDNVVRVDTENRDESGVLQPNTHFTTIYEYEILDNVVRSCEEKGAEQLDGLDDDCGDVDGNEFVTTEFEYDGNRNRTLVRLGEAANGNDPDNTERCEYDERDLVFREIRGQGAAEQSTTEYDYDGNRNRVRVAQGTEADSAPAYPGDAGRIWLREYDGYDRLLRLTDPMDNVHICEYDAAGNRVVHRFRGERVDVLGGGLNVRLYEESCDYDGMNRMTECRTEHFDTSTQLPIGDGLATRSCTWSDCSQRLSCTDDTGNTTLYLYDTANRCVGVTDPRGNTCDYTYDSNSNMVQIVETDKSDLGNPDEVFTTTYVYDGLDRRVRVLDSVGNQTDHAYDSRHNLVLEVDPRGNTRRCVYDGLDRLVAVERDLTDTGDGGGLVIGTAITGYEWDDSYRCVTFTDANSNATTYEYDSLSRVTRCVEADGTDRTHAYDAHDNRIQETDANGTVIVCEYDGLDRMDSCVVIPGAGVSNDTTFGDYEYDGLSRVVRAEDDDSVVEMDYDSCGNRIRETSTNSGQPPRTTTRIYDGNGNPILCVYPNGRTFDYAYDPLYRCVQVNEGPITHVQYDYIGSCWGTDSALRAACDQSADDGGWLRVSRIERSTNANQTQSDFQYDGIANAPGDFGVRRVVGIQHSQTFGPTFDQRFMIWDPAGNKDAGQAFGDQPLETEYAYDSMSRMVRTTEVDPGTTGIRHLRVRALDDAGNCGSIDGGFMMGPFVLDATAPNPADAQVNQYTQTPLCVLEYDANGNRVVSTHAGTGEMRVHTYDGLDRLVSVQDLLTGDTAELRYDALGRRISLTPVPTVQPGGLIVYSYDGGRVIEERDNVGIVTASYVHGPHGSGRPLVMRRFGQDFFFHRDEQGSTVAMTDQAAQVVERYSYDDYGRVLIRQGFQEPDEVLGAVVSDEDPVPFGSADIVAENVELGPQRITALRWWGGYTNGLQPDDSFNIRIYADGGGTPGPLLYEELAVTTVGRTLNGLSFGLPEYVYTYALARPFEPPVPGQHWVSIQNDTSTNTGTIWAWTLSSSGDGQLAISSNGAPFGPEPLDVAFELFTDESAVGTPYLFHGMRYVHLTAEADGYYYPECLGSTGYMDPSIGRWITRQSKDGLGNEYAYGGNNPVRCGAEGVIRVDTTTMSDVYCFMTKDSAGPTWVPLFDLCASRHSTSSSLAMCQGPSRHVDCPGHADYMKFTVQGAGCGGHVFTLKKEEGGRHTPFHNKYRPQFYLRTTDVTGAISLPDGMRMVMPGDCITMRCDTVLLDPGVTLRCDTVLLDPGVTLSYTYPDANNMFLAGSCVVEAAGGSRNGNLHMLEFTSGGEASSTLAADVAESLFYGTSYLYTSPNTYDFMNDACRGPGSYYEAPDPSMLPSLMRDIARDIPMAIVQ